jgi:hypothetical protein
MINNTSPLLTDCGVGAIAGSLEVWVNHPLWVWKTCVQYNIHTPNSLAGWYKGVFANMAYTVPFITLRIGLGRMFQANFLGDNKQLSDNQQMVSALVGGFVPSICGSPMEFMRSQQLQTGKSLLATTRDYVARQGVRELFKGLPATAIRDAFYTCGFFAIAPILKKYLATENKTSWLPALISGPAAGVIAAFGSQPFDTLKTYQQTQPDGKKISPHRAAADIISKHGYRGFFLGARPRILRIISGVTIISSVTSRP